MKHPNFISSVNVAKTSIIATTFVLAIASPVGAVSLSLSPTAALDQFKTTVTSAIDTSISQLQSSANSLNYTLNVAADSSGLTGSVSGAGNSASGSVSSTGASGTASTSDGSTASGSVSSTSATGSASTSDGSSSVSNSVSNSGLASAITLNAGDFLDTLLSIPKALVQKLQAANTKAVTQLQQLKTEVAATGEVTGLQAKAKEFDQEFKQVAQANVQAAVTKSIDSQAQVLDQLGNAAEAIQTQVTKLKACIESGSASASGSAGSDSATGSVNASAPGCTDLNVDANSGDSGQSLQDQLDSIKSSLATIKSFLSSSISLVGQLKDGNYSGTITSFSGISSQMDIVTNLSADAQNDLVNLSAAVNK